MGKKKVGNISYKGQSKESPLWVVALDDCENLLLYFNSYDINWVKANWNMFSAIGFRIKFKPAEVFVGSRATIWFRGNPEECREFLNKIHQSKHFRFDRTYEDKLELLLTNGVFDKI